MEKYCKSCGRVFKDSDFKICPYCGNQLSTRTGRQPIPRKLRHQVFQRDGYRCRECGASKDETSLEIDHIVPVAKGGTNDIDNLQTLCRECNRMKHTDEWVGGETDLEVAQNELFVLEESVKKEKNKLKSTDDENKIIEYEFNIIKLNETINVVKDNIEKIKLEEQKLKIKSEKQRNERQRRDRFFKKLYVDLNNNEIQLLSKHFNISYNNKDEIIKHLIHNYSEKEIISGLDNELYPNIEESDYKYFSKMFNQSIVGINVLLNNIDDLKNKKFLSNESKIKFLINKYSWSELENLIRTTESKCIDYKFKRTKKIKKDAGDLNRTHKTFNRPSSSNPKKSYTQINIQSQVNATIDNLTLEEIGVGNTHKLKTCPHCGKKINSSASICPNCLKSC